MEKVNIDLGKRLSDIRNTLGFNKNQSAFAKTLDTYQGNLSKMESGERKISTQVLYQLSHKHNVNMNWFFRGEGDSLLDRSKVEVTSSEYQLLLEKVNTQKEIIEMLKTQVQVLKNTISDMEKHEEYWNNRKVKTDEDQDLYDSDLTKNAG
jgi:transcriptional regulator with XRE-family HTH domain